MEFKQNVLLCSHNASRGTNERPLLAYSTFSTNLQGRKEKHNNIKELKIPVSIIAVFALPYLRNLFSVVMLLNIFDFLAILVFPCKQLI